VFGAIEERLAAHAFAAAASVSVIIAIVLIFFMSAVYRPAVAWELADVSAASYAPHGAWEWESRPKWSPCSSARADNKLMGRVELATMPAVTVASFSAGRPNSGSLGSGPGSRWGAGAQA